MAKILGVPIKWVDDFDFETTNPIYHLGGYSCSMMERAYTCQKCGAEVLAWLYAEVPEGYQVTHHCGGVCVESVVPDEIVE